MTLRALLAILSLGKAASEEILRNAHTRRRYVLDSCNSGCLCPSANMTQYLGLRQELPLEMHYSDAQRCLCWWRFDANCSDCYLHLKFQHFRLMHTDTLTIYDVHGHPMQDCLGSEGVCKGMETSSGGFRIVFDKMKDGKEGALDFGVIATISAKPEERSMVWIYALCGAVGTLMVGGIAGLLYSRRRTLLDTTPLIPNPDT